MSYYENVVLKILQNENIITVRHPRFTFDPKIYLYIYKRDL